MSPETARVCETQRVIALGLLWGAGSVCSKRSICTQLFYEVSCPLSPLGWRHGEYSVIGAFWRPWWLCLSIPSLLFMVTDITQSTPLLSLPVSSVGAEPFPPPSTGLSLEREDKLHLLRSTDKGTRSSSLIFPPGYCDLLFLCPCPWLLSHLRTLPVAERFFCVMVLFESPHMWACAWLQHVLDFIGLRDHFLVCNLWLE